MSIAIGSRNAAHEEAGIPPAWGQAYPRAVVLDPERLLVPAETLRVTLRRSRQLDLRIIGHAAEPWIVHDEQIAVARELEAEPGDWVLCQIGRWAEVRRLLKREAGRFLTALDACPRAREWIDGAQVLGVVAQPRASWVGRRVIARLFPALSYIGALFYWLRKIQAAPDFEEGAVDSITAKYEKQVSAYGAILSEPLGEETLGLVQRHVPAGGTLLVAGSGTGREAIHLARAGYRVTGVDLVPAMVESARRNSQEAGVQVEFLVADLASLDLGSRRFDGVFITPLVYSFIPTQTRRIESLRRLGNHLEPGARVVFSAHLIRRPSHFMRAVLTWLNKRLRGSTSHEYGDWYTWFLTPTGQIGKAYSHRFPPGSVLREVRAAGFRSCHRGWGAHFVAGDFHP